jgi:uncharacterized protein
MTLSGQDIKKLQNYFSHKPVLKAFLFGSHARNQAFADSDVDILVDLDYSQHIGFGFVGMKIELEDILKKRIDLVSSSSLSPHVLPFVEKDKQLIYER